MGTPVSSVVIVGGGTAGWLTAGVLAASLKKQNKSAFDITLIESPSIPIIGVGEGTWPTMRRTLSTIGVRETDFFRECNASFKQGAKFAKWVTGKDDDYYYHPLVLPTGFQDTNLAPFWQEDSSRLSFSEAVCPQESLCEVGLAPKKITTPEYAGIANYAYHLNAGKFSEFLKKHCTEKLGVRLVLDDVVQVKATADGDIAAVVTRNQGDLNGDFFVDCSGFKALLLNGHYQVPFVSKKDVLFVDSALAVQVPYPREDSAVVPHTVSTAQDAGWIWDIGLSSRRGIGHVYSSAHTTQEQAEDRLARYLEESTESEAGAADLEFRKLTINPGHREQFWVRNCVGVGLSAGFLEPLEASAILLVEISARALAEQFPHTRESMNILAKRFNQTFHYRWDRIVDFLKLHYVLSKRTDSEFWIDNRDPSTVPDSLQELLELWRYQTPWHGDFDRTVEVFPAASYQYVLYGMGFETEPNPHGVSEDSRKTAAQYFASTQQQTRQLLASLPQNRELLNKIQQYGMQRV
ncbi:MAG: tryptophan halogenase family protein [Pseudomonadota bacterium]